MAQPELTTGSPDNRSHGFSTLTGCRNGLQPTGVPAEPGESRLGIENLLCRVYMQIIEMDWKYSHNTVHLSPPHSLRPSVFLGIPPSEIKDSWKSLLRSTWPRVICNVDLKSKNLAQKSGKNSAGAPYYGNKVSSWMQLVNSVPWPFGVYFP